MSKHTPGPWMFGPPWRPDHGYGMWIVSGVHPERGQCNVLMQGDTPNHLPSDIAEANARLIASAPEMLEALEAIIAQQDRNGRPTYEQVNSARAAIAKAKGE